MNWTTLPLHPAIVHLPMGLAIVLPLLGAFLTFALWRDRLPRWAWSVVVGLQALLLAGAGMALRSGEADEDRVERVVSERFIEAHEHAAQTFTLAAAFVLALTIAVLVLRSGPARRGLSVAAVAGMLGVAGLGVRVGHAGGELVYVHGAGQAYAPPGGAAGPGDAPPPAEAPGPNGDGDDDDD